MRILAVGSPKGGVGKTTSAVTLATIAARDYGLRVLLVDSDANRSALDWTTNAGDHIPVEAVEGQDLSLLRRLRNASGYDLAVVDLPGAHEGAFRAILEGKDQRPVADLLLVPTEHEVMSVAPIQRVIRHEVVPLGLPYLVVITRIDPQALSRASDYRTQLREHYGFTVADTAIRNYTTYRDARERARTVLDVGGTHSYARHAENDYRALAAEAFRALDLPTTWTVQEEH